MLAHLNQIDRPSSPFYSDRLYQDLTENTANKKSASVHLSNFPLVNPDTIDIALENRINIARNITSLGLSLRKKEQIKVRQPLKSMMVVVKGLKGKSEIEKIQAQLCSEVNVKSIELIDDESNILVKEIKPNFKVLGPRFGKDVGQVVAIINAFGDAEIKILEQDQKININLNEKNIILELSDVEITSKDIEGWLVAHGNGLTVALDITLNEDLINEGIARELVNRIQNIRKDSGLEVTDKIEISFLANTDLKQRIENNITGCYETGSTNLIVNPKPFINTLEPYEVCDDNIDLDGDSTNNSVEFDLLSQNAAVLGGQDPLLFNVTYYLTEEDALNSSNSLNSQYYNEINPQTIYSRLDNLVNGCFEVAPLTLKVNPSLIIF